MQKLIDTMFEHKSWAVVGATDNKEKFGYKILKALKNSGYTVYPVNPGYDTVAGEKCYKSVADIPFEVDCVDVVVAPVHALKAIDSCLEKGVSKIWFQPGTYNDEVIQKALAGGLDTVYDHCVLVELGGRR